jgi:tetratricopeptide (TPR) repeat protein
MSSERRDSTMEVLLDDIEDGPGAGTTARHEQLPPPRRDPSTGVALDRDLDALLDGPSAAAPAAAPPPPPPSASSPGSVRPPPPTKAATSQRASVPPPSRALPKRSVLRAPSPRLETTPEPTPIDTVQSDEVTLLLDKPAEKSRVRAQPGAAASLEEALKRAAQSHEPGRRARAFFDAAVIAEDELGDRARAVELHRQALATAPSFLAAVQSLRRLLLASGSYEDALPLFDAEARLVADPAQRAALFVAKGALLEDRLSRRAEARSVYQQAHELDRKNLVALKELVRADWDGASELDRARWLERAAAAIGDDPVLRAELSVRRARALERDLRVETAIEAYRGALALDPECVGALEALKRLLARPPERPQGASAASSSAGSISSAGQVTGGTTTAEQRAHWLLDVLIHEIDIEADPTRRVRLRLRLADLLGGALGRLDEAITTLRTAQSEAPPELEVDVLAALADAFERADDPASLAMVLERWAEHSDTLGTRIALLTRMAEAYGRGGDAARADAIRALERALAADPTHVPTLQSLGRLYQTESRWNDLVRMHLAEADATREPARRAAAHARVAEIHERHLGATTEAIAHHLRALTALPTHVPSFHALARLYRRGAMHRELLELHRRMLETATDDGHRVALWLSIASVHEDLLDEPARAIDAYEAVLAIEPKNRVAIASLQRVGDRADRADVVVGAIDREAALEEDPARRVSLLHRAGELLTRTDPHAAVMRFRKVLDIDGAHRPTLASLGRLHHDLGQWDDLMDIHRRELELAEGPTRKALVAATLAGIAQDKLGRSDEALSWARRAFELEPTNGAIARALERQLRARNALADLRALFETELAALEKGPLAEHEGAAERGARIARTAHSLGQLSEQSVADPEKALAAYRRAVIGGALRPDALDACIRVLSRLDRTADLVALLESEARRADGPRRAALLVEAARLCHEKLADAARAAALYDDAIEHDPTATAPWLGLEDLQRRSAASEPRAEEGLARALGGQSRVLRDPRARAAALYDLGRLQARRDPSGTAADTRGTFEAMAALAPDDPIAFDALASIATRSGDDGLRARVEDVLARTTSDPVARAAHIAWLARRATDAQRDDGVALWAEAARLDPESTSIARGLARAATRAAARGTTAHEVLADSLRRLATLEPDGAERAQLLFRAATAVEETEPALAAKDLEQALALAPEREDVAEALTRLLVAQGEPERAIDALRRAAQGTRVFGHHARIAWIQAEICRDAPSATATLARAAMQLGESPDLVALQADYCEQDEQWAAALDRCERLAEIAPSPEARLEAHLRAGLLALRRLRDSGRAEQHLRAALSVNEDLRALAALAETLYLRGNLAEARDLATRWAELAQGTADEARAWTLAMQAALGMGDREGTLRAAVAAVAVEGSGGQARQAFAQLIAQSAREDRGPRVHALVQALREHTRAKQADAASYLDLAQLLHTELGRSHESADALLEGTRRHAQDPTLRRELIRRLVDAGRDRDAIGLAERRLADAPLSAEAWSELALALARSERHPWTSAPLALLGVEGRPAAPRTRMNGIPAEAMLTLAEIDPDAPIVGLLGALGEALPRLYPADLEGYGTSTREKIAARSGHALRALFDRVGAVFGSPPYELFVHRVRGRGVAIELAEPTYVLVPAWLSELSEAGQVFLAARVMGLAAARLSVVDKLTPRELEILVASATRIVAPGFGAGLTSEDVLDDQAKRIGKLLSRKARRTLDELAPRYAQSPIQDYPAFSARVARAAARVGLLVADDLERSLDVLRRIERDGQGLDFPTFLRGSPLAQDLLRYHGSEQALEVRRRFGATM